ncbi:hypothetical protein ACFVGY_36495 [Streptomyces sp. NPDC127106]|uniref:hypothetical protein n=1 Tax=Streptomyces sp. NPDC127106 TaxID=3345360 RepID=UPI0036345813
MSPAGQFCAVCDQLIRGDEGIRIVGHSASAARPDHWVHAVCDRDGRPARLLKPRPRQATGTQ